LDKFEGPLDLLLHLIEKNKIDIYDIPIVEIIAQYLEYVRQMDKEDLNLMSEFLVMAVTLLEIKAKMLLPVEVGDDEDEEDPRADLVAQLLEYRMYKYLAQGLSDREQDAERMFFKEQTMPDEVARFRPQVDLDKLLEGVTLARLQEIFEQALRRKEEKIDPIRSKFGTIEKEPISLEERVETLLEFSRSHRSFSFRELLCGQTDRVDVVVTFLAILELMRMGEITLRQETLFGEIMMERVEGAAQPAEA
jgi:segregation and condensation protein A